MLSKEQADTISNSIWVVNTALKRQGLQYDADMRQSAILYMCNCLQRYDPSKNVKWTTYAYKNVYLYIKRSHLSEIKKQQHIESDTEDGGITFIFNNFPDNNYNFTDTYTLEDVLECCDSFERHVIELKLKGYKVDEICQMTNYSKKKIWACMKSIRHKVKKNI